MLFIITIVVFAAVALAVWAVFQPRKESILGQRVQPATYRETAREIALEGSLSQRVFAPFARKIGNLLTRLVPQDALRRLEHMLVMAGEPVPMPIFLAFWVGLAGLGVLFLFYVRLVKPDLTPMQLMVMIPMVLLFTVGMPYIILRRRVGSRQKKIVRALPDALDLLVTCMEAGLGADAAFAKVAEKTSGPISETFTLYLRQVGLGRPRREALAYVADRTGVDVLVRLAAAVVQAEAVGTSLGDVLRMQSEDLRVTRREKARQKAMQAPVLMVIPMVVCFLPAMAVVILVPSVLNLFSFLGGLGG